MVTCTDLFLVPKADKHLPISAWSDGNSFFAITSENKHIYLFNGESAELIRKLDCSEFDFGAGIAGVAWRKHSTDS